MRKIILRITSFITRLLNTKPTYITINKISYPDSYLSGLYCVVTGGGKGIGFAISSKLVVCGAKVVITGRDKNALIAACNKLGANSQYIVFDSLDLDNYSKFFQKIQEIMPEFNSMVLNAGISNHENGFENVTLEDFNNQFDTNLKSNYFMAQEFIKRIKQGNLLFITSETGDMKCVLPYGLTKTCLNSLIPALGTKYYNRGIRVNGIAPGSTITNMVKNHNNDPNDYYYPNVAERYFLPEEVAEVAAFLLSEASKCISGEIIHTNAGNHFRVQ